MSQEKTFKDLSPQQKIIACKAIFGIANIVLEALERELIERQKKEVKVLEGMLWLEKGVYKRASEE